MRHQWFSVATPAFSVLIGKPKLQRTPIEDEREYLTATNTVNPDETSYRIYSTKSVFSSTINIKGCVIRQNEYVLVENGGIQSILRVSFYFSTQTNTDVYEVFCKGAQYDFICHNGICEKNFFTEYGHIHGEKTCDQYIHSKYIIRKVIILKINEPTLL